MSPAPAATGNGAWKETLDGHPSKLPSHDAQGIRAEITGSDTASTADITVTGAAPVLVLCRRLIEAGHDPAARLEAYRGDALALAVASIGAAAKLTVEEGDRLPRFRPWKAPPRAEGSAGMRRTEKSDPAQGGGP